MARREGLTVAAQPRTIITPANRAELLVVGGGPLTFLPAAECRLCGKEVGAVGVSVGNDIDDGGGKISTSFDQFAEKVVSSYRYPSPASQVAPAVLC